VNGWVTDVEETRLERVGERDLTLEMKSLLYVADTLLTFAVLFQFLIFCWPYISKYLS